jgi:hypothetical protein
MIKLVLKISTSLFSAGHTKKQVVFVLAFSEI